jgi:hypothetical protein
MREIISSFAVILPDIVIPLAGHVLERVMATMITVFVEGPLNSNHHHGEFPHAGQG